jgi:heparan-alpha-glucosaminide N-acetyltransferase
MITLPHRLQSIDVFRAVTMFLMIFVNDLWSIKDFPEWLDHAGRMDDKLGFADTIFPAFLFIVGLSIPFAIIARQAKGDSPNKILFYIVTRSFALLLMGVFHVNLENYDRINAILPKPYWQILITVGFFLIWLDYSPSFAKKKKMLLQGLGIVILIAMAAIYKGERKGEEVWMRLQWYGILGLIGWAYLLCSVIFLYSKEKLVPLIAALAFFLLFNISWNAGWLDAIKPMRSYVWIVGDASMPALTMAGVVLSVLYRKLAPANAKMFWISAIGIGLLMLIGGFALRPLGGISKIRATPSWVMICTSIGTFCFLLFIFLVDIKQKQSWFALIKPAGTSTLTAYLLPYIHYAIYNIFGKGIALPVALRTGAVGIIKCLLYSLIIILITGMLERRRIRLKI